MPPRKKQRRAAPDTPQPEDSKQSASTASARDSAQKSDTEYDLVNDPWTDEQETALLKGLVRWKPVGIHKHFRMIAISEYMKSQGYAPVNEEHTRIPGIWKKLDSLYNLSALDEMEDSVITPDAEESDESEYCPFELPDHEYGEMMFARRLASRRSESADTSTHPESRRGSTVADTDEPNSSPAPSRGRRGKSTRSSTRGTRTTRLQVEVEKPSPSHASEDEEMEDADANEGDDEEGDENTDGGEDNEEEEQDAETPSSPAARNTRTQTTKSNKKDKKGANTAAGATTRRTGRRR